AGLGAAIGAAQAGARVVLAERYGFLGGNATAALVMPLMSFHTQTPQPEKKGATTLLPTDHGPGEPVIAGALKSLLERLVRDGGLVQPMTLMFRVVGFEKDLFEKYVAAHPRQWRGVHGLWDLVRQATEAGHLSLPREDILFFATPHEEEVSVNSTRVTRVLGTDVWDLAFAEWASRRQMRQIAEFLRRYVPGFEKSYVA